MQSNHAANICIPVALCTSGKASAMSVYVAILARDGEGASLQYLCTATGLSMPTVIKARDWLLQNEYLTVVRGTSHRPAVYSIFTKADFTKADFTKADFTKGDFTKGDFTKVDFSEGPIDTIDAVTDTVSSNIKLQVTNSYTAGGECERGEYPPWFTPLQSLDGYRSKDYARTIQAFLGVCEKNHTDPALVVGEFCSYWPLGKVRHRWNDPVAALRRTLQVQINKVKGRGPPNAKPMTLAEEVLFERETGLRASSLAADAMRDGWLKKHRNGGSDGESL